MSVLSVAFSRDSNGCHEFGQRSTKRDNLSFNKLNDVMEREGDMNAFPIEDMGKTDLDKDRLYRVFGDSVQYQWQEIPDVSMYLLLLQINYKSLTANQGKNACKLYIGTV